MQMIAVCKILWACRAIFRHKNMCAAERLQHSSEHKQVQMMSVALSSLQKGQEEEEISACNTNLMKSLDVTLWIFSSFNIIGKQDECR